MAEALWWQRGVIYQIYPRSFQDTNGDGVGDLERDQRAARLSRSGSASTRSGSRRSFRSPMADFGYDVADYCDIDPLFGTLADFDALIAEAHARGLKVILDFVPNHTSDQHPWFVESRASRDNPKRDWYIWRDPAPDGGPPNNWLSNFGGTAWELRRGDRPVLLPRLPEASSRTSTGAIRRCARRCTTCCASGSTAASTAFAST